jgi:polysaccharide biosynthesis transport protein
MTNRNDELQPLSKRGEPLTRAERFVPATFVPANLPGDRGIPWREAARILRKHWMLSVAFALGLEAVLILIVLLLNTTYASKTIIEIEPPTMPQTSVSDSGVPLSTQQDYIDTQLEILKGDHMALVVIRDLRLDQNPTFMHRSWAASLLGKVSSVFSLQTKHHSDIEAVIQKFQDGLIVNQVKSSRLVEVGYETTDPKLSTAIATDMVDQYLQELHRSKYEATLRAARSVSPELEDLKNSVTTADQSLIEFQKTHEDVALAGQVGLAGDGTDATSEPSSSPIATRVSQLNQQLTAAIGDRLQQESYMKLIAAGATDSLPQMKDSPLIQDLTKQAVSARADLAQLLAIYGGNNPQVRRSQEEVESLNTQLNAERNRIIAQIKAGYQSAQNKENLLRSTLNGLKAPLDASNVDSLEYDTLRRQAQANSSLYISLSSKIKEMAVSGTLSANNVRVLEEPREPVNPTGPHRFRILGAGLVLSLLGGVVMAFIAEGMDDTICTLEDVKRLSGAPALALVPESASPQGQLGGARSSFHFLGNGRNLGNSGPILQFVTDRPNSPEAEAIRSLETAIRLQSQPPNSKIKVVTVTSAFPGEGKTTLAVNLGLALARHNKVCLVDADVRHPRITESYGLTKENGLQDLLAKSEATADIRTAHPQTPNLTILGAGKPILQPLEAVTSKQMVDLIESLRERFDYILLDAPPIIPFADSRWFSALSDGVVLVAKSSSTTKKGLTWGMEILEEIHAPVLGIVLNGVDLASEYYSYGTRKYYYQHA